MKAMPFDILDNIVIVDQVDNVDDGDIVVKCDKGIAINVMYQKHCIKYDVINAI